MTWIGGSPTSRARSKLGARTGVSVRSFGTSGVARRTASGGRGGDALVMSGSSSGIGGPKSGSSSRRSAGARRGISATAASDIGDTMARAGSGSGAPKTRSRSAPTSDIGLTGCHSLAASISDRSSRALAVSVSRRIVKSGSGTGEVREKS